MSTATIAKLVVTLGANSAQLVTELNKSKKHTKDWADYTKSAGKVASTAFAAAAASAAAATIAVLALVESSADEIDALAKTADKLGVTTEALQLFRYQNELSGVAIGTADMALQRMTRRLAEAAQGTGEAKDAIKELGLDAAALMQMSPDRQFYAIAEAMKGISNQGDKVRLAMKLFDSEGVALVNTMATDLSGVEAQFESLGVSITRQQAALVEAYNDAKTSSEYLFGGFGDKLTVYMAGPLTEVIKYIEQFVIEAGGMDAVAKAVAANMVDSFAWVIDAIAGMVEALDSAKLFMYGFFHGFEKQRGNFGAFLDQFGIDAGAEMMRDAVRNMAAIDDTAGQVIDEQVKMNQRVQSLTKLAQDMRNSIGKAIDPGTATAPSVINDAMASTSFNTGSKGSKDKKEKDSSSSSAWEKVFGKQDDIANKNLKVSQIFSDYAKSLNAAINRQDTNSMAYFVEQTQRTIDGLAGRGPNGLNFGSDRSYDIDGMQGVLDKLAAKMNETPETVGSISINVAADGKTMSGKLMGDPAFLKQLKQFVDNNTKDTARAVAR